MNFSRFYRKAETQKTANRSSLLNCHEDQSEDSIMCKSSRYSIYKTQNIALPTHADSIMNGMDALWRHGTLCDVNISTNGKVFVAHRILLASCSDYFHDIFVEGKTPSGTSINGNDITLNNISPSIIEILLGSLYTGTVTMSEANVRELLAAAAFLKVYAVEEACTDFLRTRLNLSNCLRMLDLAYTYNLSDLEEDAMKIAARNFMNISEGFDFNQLGIGHLVSLLRREDLKAESELYVFQRAMTWLNHDKANRLQNAPAILTQVRLPLLDMADIVDHVEAVDELMDIPECQRLVQEALHYHCLPARQSLLQNSRTCPRCPVKREVVLALGGAPRMKNEKVSKTINYFDDENNRWNHLIDMPGPRHHHAVATLGGFLYIVGGEESNDQRSPLQTCFRYDPRINTWLQLASMKYRRESFQLGVLNGMLFAVGGRIDEDNSLSEVERYNPAIDKWDLVAPLSVARRSVAVAAQSGRLYAVGGSGHKRISSRVERYNPLTNQWESRKSLSIPRFFAHLRPVGNSLLLFGGATLDKAGNVVCVKEVERYTPSSDTWCTVTTMLQPRAEAGATVLGNCIFVCGGYNWDKNKRLCSTEMYDAEKNSWRELASIEKAYTGIGMTSLTVYNFPAPVHREEDCGLYGLHQDMSNDEINFGYSRNSITPQKANSVG